MVHILLFIMEVLQLDKMYCHGLHNFTPHTSDSHEKITYVPTVHMKPDDGRYCLKFVWFLIKCTTEKTNMCI